VKIKLYRHVIKHTEYLPPHLGDSPIITYRRTSWSSVKNHIPRKDEEIVKTEVEEIEVENDI